MCSNQLSQCDQCDRYDNLLDFYNVSVQITRFLLSICEVVFGDIRLETQTVPKNSLFAHENHCTTVHDLSSQDVQGNSHMVALQLSQIILL